ncbi:MAG TPA: EF-hand domain-containing protein [Pirellulales bacterium]|nr:EF-hand domain-containing protein [Pirellulales bacterium]
MVLGKRAQSAVTRTRGASKVSSTLRLACAAGWCVSTLVLSLSSGCNRSQNAPAKPPGAGSPAPQPAETVALDAKAVKDKSPDAQHLTPNAPAPANEKALATDAGAVPSTSQAPAPMAGDGTERFVVFTPRGPLIVEIRMTIDGKPFAAVRAELVDEFLRMADGDHDGKPTWTEVFADPKRVFGGRTDLGIEMKNRREFLKAHDTNSNGLVDRDEARRFIAQINRAGAAFALDGSTEYRGMNQRESPLRRLLDADADEMLSSAELAGAIDRLRSRDANDDDILELDELRDAPVGNAMGMNASGTANLSPPAAARLGPNANWDAVRYAFSELYLDAGRIREGSFSLTKALIGQLDANADGWLASEELAGLDTVAPHIELEANFGRTGERTPGLAPRSMAAELIAAAGLERAARSGICENSGAGEMVSHTADGFVLDLPGVLLRFQGRDRVAGDDERPPPEEQLAALDADKNGYLEKPEVEGQEQAAGAVFDDWDADGDGKVYASEIAGYDRRRRAPRLSAVRAAVNDDQDILFALLDVDQDGRLTARELKQVAERLGWLDRDGDGSLSYDELPASIGIVFDRGNRDDRAPRGAVAAAATASGPSWFIHMDTNHDQFISPREFPGSPAKFAALDADGDGFIDRAEAETAP